MTAEKKTRCFGAWTSFEPAVAADLSDGLFRCVSLSVVLFSSEDVSVTTFTGKAALLFD